MFVSQSLVMLQTSWLVLSLALAWTTVMRYFIVGLQCMSEKKLRQTPPCVQNRAARSCTAETLLSYSVTQRLRLQC